MPKIIVIIVLIAGLGISLILLSQRTGFFSKASPPTFPEQIKITNISDNSFTISWITPGKKTIGFVKYGTNAKLLNVTGDDRDIGNFKSRSTHHVTIKNLIPNTNYYFKINSGGIDYDNKGQLFLQKTAVTTDNPPNVPDSIFGKVQTSDKKTIPEALVYVAIDNAQALSSYTREDGNWLITFNNARTTGLDKYYQVADFDKINILIQGGMYGKTQGRISADQKTRQIISIIN